jgi:hypothetical protein
MSCLQLVSKSSGTERELGGIEGILGFTEARAIGL